MKKILVTLSMLASIGVFAQQSTIHIAGTRLTYPLFQKWIDEYSMQHPNLHFILNSKQTADSVDISIVSHRLATTDIKAGKTAITISRYVQLPVVNSNRSDVVTLQEKGFNDAKFKQVYFGETSTSNIASDAVFTVYKRKQNACASQSFANHFGSEQKDIKGVPVLGDDKDLLNAVKQDVNGISYNNLGFIYDLKTRKLIDSIAIIPIDFNENGKIDANERIYGTLDNVLTYAEKTNSTKLLIEEVHVLYDQNNSNKEVANFLKWILINGQQFNHEYGFINLLTGTKKQSIETIKQGIVHVQ